MKKEVTETMAMIGRRVSNAVKQRARGYRPRVTGFDKQRSVWFFSVGDYVVKFRAVPMSEKQQRVERMGILVSCSCPGWRWNGSEHWAKKNTYQYAHPRGTATFPGMRDPKMKNGVCKHVWACFLYVRENKLKIPVKKANAQRRIPA